MHDDLKKAKAEIRRLRKALREVQVQADEALEGDSRPEIDRLTDPLDGIETIYSIATKAWMGPEKFKKWVAKREREIAEAT